MYDAPKDPVTSPVPLPPSSHAKPVDSFAEASELENELSRVVRGEVRFDPGARAVCPDASNYRQIPIGLVVPRAPPTCRPQSQPVRSMGLLFRCAAWAQV